MRIFSNVQFANRLTLFLNGIVSNLLYHPFLYGLKIMSFDTDTKIIKNVHFKTGKTSEEKHKLLQKKWKTRKFKTKWE